LSAFWYLQEKKTAKCVAIINLSKLIKNRDWILTKQRSRCFWQIIEFDSLAKCLSLSHRFLLVFILVTEFVRVLILCETDAKYCNTFEASSAHSFSSDYHEMLFWFFLQHITAYSYRFLTEFLIFSFPLFFGQTQRIFLFRLKFSSSQQLPFTS
jgi:hypothetical protein